MGQVGEGAYLKEIGQAPKGILVHILKIRKLGDITQEDWKG